MSDIESEPDAPVAPLPAELSLASVRLTNFRSYTAAELQAGAAPIALFGANGIGKTNLLEAVSMLSPGRGLRGATLADIQRRAPSSADALWAVSATLVRGPDTHDIGTGLAAADGSDRRVTRLNGAASASTDIAELLPMLWLTPAMDRLFLEDASGRRKFLDRLVFGLDAGHARRAVRYENARRERARLFRTNEGSWRNDGAWFDGIEGTMAEAGAAMTEARLATIERLNAELMTRGQAGAFPCAHLALEDSMALDEAVDAAKLREALAASRTRDAESGHTSVGPHRSDLVVRHTGKRADARDCSTGEQKSLLVSIVLANAWIQRTRNGVPPLLLLDEVAAHLDAARRAALFEEVLALGSQTWMTGTDRSLFAPLGGRALFLSIANGQFVHADHGAAP